MKVLDSNCGKLVEREDLPKHRLKCYVKDERYGFDEKDPLTGKTVHKVVCNGIVKEIEIVQTVRVTPSEEEEE